MTYTFRSLFRKAELDRDLDEELRSYLDLLTEKNRKAGMSLQEARRSAHLVMEGSEQVKEEVREVRMGAKIDALGLDFRYALRAVGKNPGFTLIVALILALGIGASTAIFSAVNGILLRPYPYRHPERILTLWRFETDKGTVGNGISPGNFLDIKEQSLAFSDMAIMRPYGLDFTGDGDPESFTTWLVSEGFFRIMGMNPLHGRTFLPAEFTAGHNRVVVFSYGLWQRRFGGDPGLVGRSIRLDEEAFLVVGIMPPEFRMPGDIEAFAPKVLTQQDRLDRRSDYQKAVARLKPDRTLEEAQVEIDLIAERLAQAYPKPNEGVGVKLRTWPEQMLGPIRMNLLVLLGAVFLVLLIACSNVANLFLARGTERQREFALRAALGAGGYRLIRQLLFESLLLALLGGAGGLFLAYWGTQVLVGLSPADIPRLEYVRLDGTVLAFTFGMSILTALLFGLGPAVQHSRPDLHNTLRESGSAGLGGIVHRNVRGSLVVAQIALAMVLLVGAGLLLRSFIGLLNVDLGFTADKLLALQVFVYGEKYPNGSKQYQFFDQTLEGLSSIPGVQSAGAVSYLPFVEAQIGIAAGFTIEGRPAPPKQELPKAMVTYVSRDYFQTMGIPLLKGRNLDRFDTRDTASVVLVNESMVKRFWQGENPVGRKIVLQDFGDSVKREIVGVMGDIRHGGLEGSTSPEVFLPLKQNPFGSMTLVVRTSSGPATLLPAARRQIWAVDPDLTIYSEGVMNELITNSVGDRRFLVFLLGTFAGIALLLAATGIYGVISLLTSMRTHEIGVRIALGARPGRIFRLVLGQGLICALIGIAIGLGGAYGITRFLKSFLFGITPTDPATLAFVSLLLISVALLASYVPARRATRIDPVTAIRYE